MNVFVIATTLQAGGGITIYKQFLSHLPEHIGEDKYWIFINPVLPQVPIEGVTYILLPVQAKIKRTLFEGKLLKAKVAKLGVKPDMVVSLQNNGYKCFNDCKQVVYFHQSLPLYPGFYNPLKCTERILFNYKYVFPRIVKKTWVKNTQFVVQTSIVKNRLVSYFGIPEENVHVCFPDIEKIDVSQCKAYDWGDNKHHLIFVGDGLKYRNGKTLVKAMRILKKQNLILAEKIKIHITSSVKISPQLHKEVIINNVANNFVFEGVIKHDILLGYYKSATTLLFPSSIETVGLPLIEAAIFGLPIVAANIDYAREVIKDYDGVRYADVHDYEAWAKYIIELCENSKRFNPLSQERKSDWTRFFNLISKQNMNKKLFFEQGVSANGVTTKEKIKELLWSVVNDTLFRFTLRPMNIWRAFLLRLFGAKISRDVYIHQTVKVLRPWNLKMGAKASLDYGCVVRNDAKIFIGDNVSVGAYTTFMPGGHDVRSRGFEFIGKETHIAHGVFIGGRCLIRDVNIGQFSVIGAGSFVTKDIPENVIAFGWPVKVRSERIPNEEYKKYRYDG